ncbi:hypothetical protein [uncultured Mucilaginibacter sp.]|uniref:hypothetical protein n=1 Tax=uncultured Mucilaginibacter sp. TaxID=797541 RepID=UPI0025F3A19A|nr:hypothetical protein [uncultured Mucilaginibacter sp.]
MQTQTLQEELLLESELQDLYKQSRHWLSDIQFVEDEIRFFKDISNTYLVPYIDRELLDKVKNFTKAVFGQESNIMDLKRSIPEFLKFVAPYVTDTEKKMGIVLLETFNDLQSRVTDLLDTVREEKKQLFLILEDAMQV